MISDYFSYISLTLMSLIRILGAKYGDWSPAGTAYMYAFVSLKIKPGILKLILVYVSQTYIDSLIFPYFNKEYDKLEAPHVNYDLYINAVICLTFYLVNKVVPYLGLENKRKLAK